MINVLYPLSNLNNIFIEFEGTYKYVSPVNNHYTKFIDTLKSLYSEKYSHEETPNPDKILGLIRTNNKFRGYKFNIINNQTLYCCIYRFHNTQKTIGKKFINEFLSDKNLKYSFCGISDEYKIKEYYSDNIIYKNIVSTRFIDFFEFFKLILRSGDPVYDSSGFNYAIHYILNTQPEKLDFLINETK